MNTPIRLIDYTDVLKFSNEKPICVETQDVFKKQVEEFLKISLRGKNTTFYLDTESGYTSKEIGFDQRHLKTQTIKTEELDLFLSVLKNRERTSDVPPCLIVIDSYNCLNPKEIKD